MADILESMAYIQNQGERGFERGQKTKLASLFGQAYNAPREQRQSLLGQMASVSPQAAFDAEKHFSSMDDMSREEMGRYAMAFDALPDDQKPQAYPAFAMQMQKMGLPAPVQWNPEYAPRIRQFAQAWGGAGATGGMVQSRFVGEDGQIYALMRDGSVSPLGIKADPNTQIMEAAGGIYSIDKRNAQAQPVQVGQHAPQQPAMQQVQYATEDGQPIPANEQEAFLAAVREDQQSQGGQLQAAPPKVAPKGPPAGYRFTADGKGLEVIPGGPAQLTADAREEAARARRAAEAAKAEQMGVRQAEAAAAANQLVSAIDTLTKSPGFDDLGTVTGDLKLHVPLLRNEAKDSHAQLKNIAGQVALTTMARLRALSAQGATGFGALSAPELKLLENSIATLQSEDISNSQLKESLRVIRDSMGKITKWSGGSGAAQGGQRPPANAPSNRFQGFKVLD